MFTVGPYVSQNRVIPKANAFIRACVAAGTLPDEASDSYLLSEEGCCAGFSNLFIADVFGFRRQEPTRGLPISHTQHMMSSITNMTTYDLQQLSVLSDEVVTQITAQDAGFWRSIQEDTPKNKLLRALWYEHPETLAHLLAQKKKFLEFCRSVHELQQAQSNYQWIADLPKRENFICHRHFGFYGALEEKAMAAMLQQVQKGHIVTCGHGRHAMCAYFDANPNNPTPYIFFDPNNPRGEVRCASLEKFTQYFLVGVSCSGIASQEPVVYFEVLSMSPPSTEEKPAFSDYITTMLNSGHGNKQDENGKTALLLAIQRHNTEFATHLLTHRLGSSFTEKISGQDRQFSVNINLPDRFGNYLMAVAIIYDNYEVYRCILQYRAHDLTPAHVDDVIHILCADNRIRLLAELLQAIGGRDPRITLNLNHFSSAIREGFLDKFAVLVNYAKNDFSQGDNDIIKEAIYVMVDPNEKEKWLAVLADPRCVDQALSDEYSVSDSDDDDEDSKNEEVTSSAKAKPAVFAREKPKLVIHQAILQWRSGNTLPDFVALCGNHPGLVNARDEDGLAPLMWAIHYQCMPAITALLQCPQIMATLDGYQGKGPGRVPTLHYLLDRNIHRTDPPLLIAIMNSGVELCRSHLGAAQPFLHRLFQALSDDSPRCQRIFDAIKPEQIQRINFNVQDKERNTLLHRLIKAEQYELAIKFIRQHQGGEPAIDPNLLDSDGNSIIHLAAQKNQPKLMKVILHSTDNPSLELQNRQKQSARTIITPQQQSSFGNFFSTNNYARMRAVIQEYDDMRSKSADHDSYASKPNT